MFTDIQQNDNYLSLKEQFIKQLEKNIKAEIFRNTESELRMKLKKEFEKGSLKLSR
jgi:hypothetical protein